MQSEASARSDSFKTALLISVVIGVPAVAFSSVAVAVATDLPELVFLLAMVIYFLLSERYKCTRFCGDAYRQVVTFVSSLPLPRMLLFITICVSLVGAVLCEMPQMGLALASAMGYFCLNAIGRSQKLHGRNAKQLKCKTSPLTSAGSPKPWRQAPVQTPRQPAPLPETSRAVPAKRDGATQRKADQPTRDSTAVEKLPQALKTMPQHRRIAEIIATKEVPTARLEPNELELEIQELVRSLSPNPADDQVVRQLVCMVRKSVNQIIPEAKIVGSAVGDLTLIQAQGIKPEVDIAVMVSPDVLAERLKAFYLKGPQNNQKKIATLCPELLQKTATRVLSERLTSLRFWRSQFTGPDPKIVLLAPATLGICDYPLRVNFYVNNPYAQRLKSVVSNCDVRSNALVLLVMQWANFRGLSNTAKGHLSPYGYTLLAIHFLRDRCADDLPEKSTIQVFEEFVRFYSAWVHRDDALLSVRFTSGVDAASVDDEPCCMYIEDPFGVSSNAAVTVTAHGVTRLKEELVRASSILEAGIVSLAPLLERWTPPATPSEPSA